MAEIKTQKIVPIPVGDVLVELLAEGDAIARMTLNGKAWEPETRAAWHTFIREGEMVIDIGAYTGVYTIASRHMGAVVLAFEPHPTNFARLKANGAINSTRFIGLPCAVSDRDGPTLLRYKKSIGNLSDTASLVIDDQLYNTAVQGVRLDSLNLQPRVAFIKIDIEGHEAAVLLGAVQTIAHHRPNILIETLDESAYLNCKMVLTAYAYREQAVLDRRNRLFVPI